MQNIPLNLARNKRKILTPLGYVGRRFIRLSDARISDVLAQLTPGIKPNRNAIAWFLALGYIPGRYTLFEGVEYLSNDNEIAVNDQNDSTHRFSYAAYVQPNCYRKWSLERLIEEASSCFRQAIRRTLDCNRGQVVIPISGGLDSRAILAAVLELLPPEKIQSYTFGTPGTWDYDIGCLIAQKTGINHRAYDLTLYPVTRAGLQRISILSDGNTDLFTFPPLAWIERDFDTNSIYWLGFMGDPLAGSHIPSVSASTAIEHFMSFDRQSSRYSARILNPPLRPDYAMLSLENVIPGGLPTVTEYELLDFENRQERYTAHQLFLRGFRYATPFLDPDWIRFILSVPIEYRINQRLYRQMLRHEFPDLFSLPTKNRAGLPLSAGILRERMKEKWVRIAGAVAKRTRLQYSPPHINYMDFEAAMRTRKDFRGVIRDSLNGLMKMGLVDKRVIDDLWLAATSGQRGCTTTLRLLSSLEIILSSYRTDCSK
jgi:hypothetical protein